MTATASTNEAVESTPAKPARKRAPRKTAKKAVAAADVMAVEQDSADASAGPADAAPPAEATGPAQVEGPTLGTFTPVAAGRGPGSDIERDQHDRPLILQPDGSRLPYWSASKLGEVLEYQGNLSKWKTRQAMIGLSLAPHLVVSVAAFRNDRDRLDQIAKDAMKRADSDAKSVIGTALHTIFETIDKGQDPGPIPDAHRGDVEAYTKATTGWRYAGMETFVVCDELLRLRKAGAAGSFDRLRIIVVTRPDGSLAVKLRIVDIKTSGSLQYSYIKFGVQFAVYAWGELYDPSTGARRPLTSLVDPVALGLPAGTPVEVDREVAEIVYLPSGTGECQVVEVTPLAQAWDAAQEAVENRARRNYAKGWLKPVGQVVKPSIVVGVPAPNLAPSTPPDPIASAIAQARSEAELGQIATYYQQWWTPAHSELANARWVLLRAGAA